MTEADARREVRAGIIGAAVHQAVEHAADIRGGHRGAVAMHDSGDAAHQCTLRGSR